MSQQELLVRLAETRGVMLDIDGCLMLSDKPAGEQGQPLPGAIDLIAAIRRSGRSLVVFTNGSQQTPADIARSLRASGLEISDEEVMTPAVVAAEVVSARHPNGPVLAFGGHGITSVLQGQGISLIDHEEAFRHGPPPVEAVQAGATIYCTSSAPSFASRSRLNVGVSGFIATGLAHVTGQPYRVLGKPSDEAMAAIESRLGVPSESVLVLGDDLVLECSMAKRHGALAGLVTTGTHSAEDAHQVSEDNKPDFVIDSLYEVVRPLEALPALSEKGVRS